MLHKVAGLDKHPTTSAGRVQQDALFGLQNVDDHLDQGFRRKEYPIILGNVLGKLVKEVLINAADHVPAHIVQGAVVEDSQQLRQQFIGKHGVILGKNSGKLFALLLYQFHGVVDCFTQAGHEFTVPVGQVRFGNVFRKIDQISILGFTGQKESTARGKVAGFHRQHPSATHRAIFKYFRLHQLKAAVSIAQKNKPQNRHTVLV